MRNGVKTARDQQKSPKLCDTHISTNFCFLFAEMWILKIELNASLTHQ
jgi:hypothetical protein